MAQFKVTLMVTLKVAYPTKSIGWGCDNMSQAFRDYSLAKGTDMSYNVM